MRKIFDFDDIESVPFTHFIYILTYWYINKHFRSVTIGITL